MVKRIPKSGNVVLLSKSDRSELAAFKKASQKHVNKVTRTPEKAMQELVDAGIYGTDHKLKKQYRSVA